MTPKAVNAEIKLSMIKQFSTAPAVLMPEQAAFENRYNCVGDLGLLCSFAVMFILFFKKFFF